MGGTVVAKTTNRLSLESGTKMVEYFINLKFQPLKCHVEYI